MVVVVEGVGVWGCTLYPQTARTVSVLSCKAAAPSVMSGPRSNTAALIPLPASLDGVMTAMRTCVCVCVKLLGWMNTHMYTHTHAPSTLDGKVAVAAGIMTHGAVFFPLNASHSSAALSGQPSVA